MDPRVRTKRAFESHNAAHITDSLDLNVYIDKGAKTQIYLVIHTGGF